jgi:hypothetical protein
MSPIRQRMLQDMQLRGLAARTPDGEITYGEQVFSRYEPSRPSFKLISILQQWEDTKDGTYYRQPDPNHFSNQDSG